MLLFLVLIVVMGASVAFTKPEEAVETSMPCPVLCFSIDRDDLPRHSYRPTYAFLDVNPPRKPTRKEEWEEWRENNRRVFAHLQGVG